jgi:hypothetical protein
MTCNLWYITLITPRLFYKQEMVSFIRSYFGWVNLSILLNTLYGYNFNRFKNKITSILKNESKNYI